MQGAAVLESRDRHSAKCASGKAHTYVTRQAGGSAHEGSLVHARAQTDLHVDCRQPEYEAVPAWPKQTKTKVKPGAVRTFPRADIGEFQIGSLEPVKEEPYNSSRSTNRSHGRDRALSAYLQP